jgi:Arc/MetJ-type ribon-helix-helix transcriptional regulator
LGGRSNAIRLALRNLGQDFDRNEALGAFLADWQSDAGEVNEADVDAMTRRYKL